MSSLLLLLSLLIVGPVAPNPRLTPGVVRPLSRTEICETRWGRDRRHVTLAMRKDVFRRYRIPYSKHALYELDHLVPRELAGADDIANLWPQLWDDARQKDREENRLHRAVCAGSISLADAQQRMRTWGR